MPSAKSHRAQLRKASRNKMVKSFTRSRVTRARHTVESDESSEDAETAVRAAISALDKAARKGVIHPNQAARKKSRLQRGLNQAAAG